MATRLSTATFGYQNFFSATLSSDITAGATSIGLSTVPTPTAGILVIEPDSTTNREVVLYTSKGASTVTAPSDGRGYSGSTAVSHLQGAAVIMAPVDKWFTALASGELSSDPLRTELFFDYVASGLVWTADAAGSTKNASMTSGVIYILGKRLTLAAVTARVFTASKDTYIDVSDNGDGTGLITYNEVTNNAASPALSTNNIRIGIIVTGATNIAAAGSVNQGQEDRVLPIASSIPYAVTDSLGNLICPRDPLRRVLGYRQIVANFSVTSATLAQITGLTCPVIVPTGRKVKVSLHAPGFSTNAIAYRNIGIFNGTIGGGGVQIGGSTMVEPTANNYTDDLFCEALSTPASTSMTYNGAAQRDSGTSIITGTTTAPPYIKVELA
jgi:hypothetical protein